MRYHSKHGYSYRLQPALLCTDTTPLPLSTPPLHAALLVCFSSKSEKHLSPPLPGIYPSTTHSLPHPAPYRATARVIVPLLNRSLIFLFSAVCNFAGSRIVVEIINLLRSGNAYCRHVSSRAPKKGGGGYMCMCM